MGEGEPQHVDARFAPLEAVPRSLDEVRARPVTDGLWQLALPLPYPATKRVNAYLLDTDDGRCLIDCGSRLDPGWEFIEHALSLAGAKPDEIALLVTTHHHSDHAGQAERVLHETGAEYLHFDGPQTLNEFLRDYLVPLEERLRACRVAGVPEELAEVWATATIAGDAQVPNPEPHRRLREGDVLPSLVGSWTVVPATGHNASQLALFNAERGWLLSADLILRTLAPFLEWGVMEDPYALHLAALERARTLAPRLLLPGHGRPVVGVDDQLRFAVRAAEGLSDRALALLEGAQRTPYELAFQIVKAEADLDTRQAMLSTVLCILDHHERRGVVSSSYDERGVRRVRHA